jgi:CRP-like cAMP-binding protein
MPGSDSARAPGPVDGFLVVVQRGDYIFREGDRSEELYLVEEGRVELTSRARASRRTVLEAGDFCGEQALADGGPRDGSAQALTRCRLLRLDRATFASLVRQNPDIALAMLSRLTRAAGARYAAAGAGVLIHEASGVEFALTAESHSVGRSSQTRGVQPDVDLTRFDPEKSLSRRHARIVRKPDGFYVVQEEGRNGTFLNGRRLEPDEETSVTNGDHLTFGLVELVFRVR